MSKRHRKHQIGVCAYCGQSAEITDDHVVPQCLFGGKAPADAPVVPACGVCNNNEKSQDDTYFRDFLASDFHTNLSTPARELFNGKFLRAVGRNQSNFAHDFEGAQPVNLVMPSGLIVGAYGKELPDNRISYILARMVRGLYYYYIGQRIGVSLPLPSRFAISRKYDLQVVMGEMMTLKQLIDQGALVGNIAPVGDGSVFSCSYAYYPPAPEVSQWYLNFFDNTLGGATFFVGTNIGSGIATVVA